MITTEPRPYQVPPLETFYWRQSILLAFDTGLGKTWCAVAAAEHLLETAQVDRVLLVVPAGLKFQWAEALAKFTDLPTQVKKFKGERIIIPDSRYCMVVNGTPEARKKQYRLARETATCNYMVTGYDNVINDERDIRRFRADMIVLDEASAIKTLSSARTKAVKQILDAPWRMALTATPIDNRPDELFSIMEWVDPDVLGRGDLFDQAYIDRNRFGDPIGYKNLHVLHRKVAGAMYRKSVNDPEIVPFMPGRKFLEWVVPFDVPTKDAYIKMAHDLYRELRDAVAAESGWSAASHYAGEKHDADATPMGRAMARHTAMEMLCDHPDLIEESALDYMNGGDKGSKYAAEVYGSGLLDDLTHSPKLRYLMAKMDVLMADPGSKVIIFTRYRRMQEIIFSDLLSRGWDVVQYHGELSTAEQVAARARFLNDPGCRVFVSTHAGERGTDLPVANWLINYDTVWSAGQADQINGRHMRTSSEFSDIYVASLYLDGSVEQRKLEQQDDKRRVSRAVVDGKMPKTGRVGMDADGLRKHIESWLTANDPDGMVLLHDSE